jgi:hypothetical protein
MLFRSSLAYQCAEAEIEALTGVKISHSTQQRLVMKQEFPLPQAKQPITEVSIDGGISIRGVKKEGSY